MPLINERWQSSRWPAPKACATKVSKPISKPPPKKATTLKMPELMLTAPMEFALSGKCPTMTVSTMPMVIQPISARTRGSARRRVGRISARSVCSRSIWRLAAKLGSVSGDRERRQTKAEEAEEEKTEAKESKEAEA